MRRRAILALVLAASCDKAQPPPPKAHPVVEIETSLGSIEVELYPDWTPVTVRNFLDYVERKHYDGTIFHRVIPGFMIQGGGFERDMREKPTGPPIRNEAPSGLRNDRGTIAMARTSVIDSATSQFFLNLKDNDFLNHGPRDYGYCAFGKITGGMEVVDRIAQVSTTRRGPHENVPVEPVLLIRVQTRTGP